ncbi:MAG: hypothetical protein K0Q77_1245 [Anaerosporomusa subterranea]|jgi:diguanylate cyclase (GGDEF)-like protein/PAS domain S-box-containing protein|nr:hypothetical protein [Anaerosporomusa subterranea]
MIWRSGLDAKCNYFNKTWLNFTGRQLEEEMGNGWTQGVHKDDLERCLKIYLDNFSAQKPFEMEYRLKCFDGEYRWINDRGVPFYDNDAKFLGFIGSCIDITEKIEGQILKELAQIDDLCQINSRQYAEKLIRQKLERTKNEGNISLTIINIDNFKRVNDRYGQNVSHAVLRKVSRAIQDSVRQSDICGRYDGEKFIVGLPDTDSREASNIAERIRQAVHSLRIKHSHGSFTVTASIGVCQITDEEFLDMLIDKVDQALLKNRGKDCVTVYNQQEAIALITVSS